MKYCILVIMSFLLLSCDKESFRDYRYIYCSKENADDDYWGCHNIVVDERLSYSDSIELHKYLDRNAKERLSDTSNFVSQLTFIYDEHSWVSPKHKMKN